MLYYANKNNGNIENIEINETESEEGIHNKKKDQNGKKQKNG